MTTANDDPIQLACWVLLRSIMPYAAAHVTLTCDSGDGGGGGGDDGEGIDAASSATLGLAIQAIGMA